MRSPVSRRALGEWNAITRLRSGHRELTFDSTLGNLRSKLPISVFLSSFRIANDSGINRRPSALLAS
jgi:hypothetical protein